MHSSNVATQIVTACTSVRTVWTKVWLLARVHSSVLDELIKDKSYKLENRRDKRSRVGVRTIIRTSNKREGKLRSYGVFTIESICIYVVSEWVLEERTSNDVLI